MVEDDFALNTTREFPRIGIPNRAQIAFLTADEFVDPALVTPFAAPSDFAGIPE